jgi:CDP-glucose 4,6-dehydratase
METMGLKEFWNGKKVLITGHTGFKGSWLSLWLHSVGAQVFGYSLKPSTNPSMFELCELDQIILSEYNDIRNYNALANYVEIIKPQIVFHMAAQPLVRDSYLDPVQTYSVNVMGTVHLLEAVRNVSSVKVVVNVTTDKCYENKEWYWGYRENEPLGGFDPYSSSKACSELVTSAYRNSFFTNSSNLLLASARAGNVIGGGDWAKDRLIPDCIAALLKDEKVIIRSPNSIRPWQHVLEPLSGYMLLAEKLYIKGEKYASAWNFGPEDTDAKTVQWIVDKICNIWGDNSGFEIDASRDHPHEANYLKLDCSKAKQELGWLPRWDLEMAINKIVEWNRAYLIGENLREVSLKQINEYRNQI